MGQSACLVINQITVDICFPLQLHAGWWCIVGPNIKLVELFKLVGAGLILVCCLVIRGSIGGSLLLRDFSGVVSHSRARPLTQYVVSVEYLSLVCQRLYS